MTTIAVKEKPIPFSIPMARAILDGRKTQTRRIIKEQPVKNCAGLWCWQSPGWPNRTPSTYIQSKAENMTDAMGMWCPYGRVGDRLWVREPWQVRAGFNKNKPSELANDTPIWYLADGEWTHMEGTPGKYRHSRFMPRWVSRTNLEITEIRVERLHDMSYTDAKEEGVILTPSDETWEELSPQLRQKYLSVAKTEFKKLWKSINGPDSWDANPWVWVVEFKPVRA